VKSLLILVCALTTASAELLHIELQVGGLDCISCAQSVDKALKRIKGVDTASFRTQDSTAVVDLKPGNEAKLEQVRDAVKGIGYTPKAAKVTARGEAREEAGKWLFRVTGSGAEYELDVSETPGIVGMVAVEGSIAGAGAPLKLSGIRR
jgi:cation transport ATPase